MTDDEAKTLMARYGITAAQKTVYHYKGFKYENLMDALDYAELATEHESSLRYDGKMSGT